VTLDADVAPTDDELPIFELLEEIELGPRKWLAAGPPIWDSAPQPIATHLTEDQPPRWTFKTLTIDIPPCSPSRATFRSLPKENLASPTERAFARLRARGSSRELVLSARVACSAN
jgi:hypothetical protein